MKSLVILIVITLTGTMGALTGCASIGREINPDQLATVRKGVTTRSEIIQQFGAPTTTRTSSNGARTLVYTFAHAQARPETFIPFIGPFIGGTDSRSTTLEISIARDDTVADYSVSQSNISTGFGQYASPDRTQPQEIKP